jgi:hypothetical protein
MSRINSLEETHLCPDCDELRREHNLFRVFGQQPFRDRDKVQELSGVIHRFLRSLRADERCQFCAFLLRLVERTLPSRESGDIRIGLSPFLLSSRKDSVLRLDRAFNITNYSLSFQPICPGAGRVIPPQLNFDQPKLWMKLCSTRHGAVCTPQHKPVFRPTFKVIDAKQRRVVHAPIECSYIALSYVWGTGVPLLTLNETTKQRLYESEGLADSWTDIPTTIKDSMYVCEMLEVRYLWIDALCIQQDAPDKMVQVEQAYEAYANAVLTIVAGSSSSSWSGLSGIRGKPREEPQIICRIDDVTLAGCVLPSFQLESSTKWDRHGWTLQEKVTSDKLLVFAKDQVFWWCNSAQWCEDCSLDTDDFLSGSYEFLFDMDPVKPSPRNVADGWDAMNLYMGLISNFANRGLTEPKDSIFAFSAILRSFSFVKEQSHHFGLPRSFLDLALLFNLFTYKPSTRQYEYPSWTWAGWNPRTPVSQDLSHPVSKDDWKHFRTTTHFFHINNTQTRSLVATQKHNTMYTTSFHDLMRFEDDERRECEKVLDACWDILPHKEQLLIFSTCTLPVVLRRVWYANSGGVERVGYGMYEIDALFLNLEGDLCYVPTGSSLCPWLEMEDAWASDPGRRLELAVIAAQCLPLEVGQDPLQSMAYYCMLIETDDRGISSKIACLHWTTQRALWERMPSARMRIVILQ